MSNIFERRVAYQPYEYPEVVKYGDAISHSFWLHTEWNFTADVQDFHTKLTFVEQSALKNSLLAISQIEVSVKKFWAKLGDRFPKAEFDEIGVTFAESEVRHARAYSNLIKILGLNDDFANVLQVPAIKGRVEYLTKYLANISDSSHEKYALTLTLFSLFIENVSLFSQFAVVKAFNKHKNILKDIDNVIQATQQEEQIHAMLGAEILKYIKLENPEWFNEEFYSKFHKACNKAYIAEAAIIDWIFEQGEVDFISCDALKEFIKKRFNQSAVMIGSPLIFEIDETKVESLKWFETELLAEVNNDFFNKKSTSYSKKMKPVTAEELF